MNFVFCFLSRLPHGIPTVNIFQLYIIFYVERDEKYTDENDLPTWAPQRIVSNALPFEMQTESIFNGVDGKTYRCFEIVGNNDDLNHWKWW